MPFILRWEGGFSDHPADRGGATNKGVTLSTFQQFYGADRTADDLRAMTDEQWLRIFREGYWNRWQADRIASQSLANLLVDWVWASGSHGITRPQRILGVEADGIVGEQTLAALAARARSRSFTSSRRPASPSWRASCARTPRRKFSCGVGKTGSRPSRGWADP